MNDRKSVVSRRYYCKCKKEYKTLGGLKRHQYYTKCKGMNTSVYLRIKGRLCYILTDGIISHIVDNTAGGIIRNVK